MNRPTGGSFRHSTPARTVKEMPLDWDKLRVFHAAASAGSFTHAGDQLGLSQSAVSRQVSALEHDLKTPLFHRHARGLILTEQGELLYRTAHEVMMKLEAARTKLTDSRDKPNGDLRVTTSVGLGSGWLSPRIGEFMELYPDIKVQFILADEELDLAMREADVAIRLRQPTQPDLIQRKLFTVHFHACASPEYIKRFGMPKSFADLDRHRLIGFGGPVPAYLLDINWLATAGLPAGQIRPNALTLNNIWGVKRAVQAGVGIAVLPDYLIEGEASLIQLFPEADMPTLDAYFVYPEELKSVARIQVFRDFLIANAQRWSF